MELAPSKDSGNKIILDGLDDSEQSKKEEKLDSIPDVELVRIKVIESFPEPVMVGSGEEILLEKDDVHFLDQETADWLVESGVAEVESL